MSAKKICFKSAKYAKSATIAKLPAALTAREKGDGRKAKGERRREEGDGRKRMGERRRKKGDGRKETGDRRWEKGDRR